jgi:hypothetical protein
MRPLLRKAPRSSGTNGIPHIFAPDHESLFQAYGYAQMEAHPELSKHVDDQLAFASQKKLRPIMEGSGHENRQSAIFAQLSIEGFADLWPELKPSSFNLIESFLAVAQVVDFHDLTPN